MVVAKERLQLPKRGTTMRKISWILCQTVVINFVPTALLAFPHAAKAQANTVDACCGYIIKSNVKFAWVRTEPSSMGRVVATLYPGELVVKALPWDSSTLSSDGTRYWLKVVAKKGAVTGWIEGPSLTFASPGRTPRQSRAASADWLIGPPVRVRTGVTFVWLRAYPSSFASALSTSYSGYNLSVMGKPVADNRQ